MVSMHESMVSWMIWLVRKVFYYRAAAMWKRRRRRKRQWWWLIEKIVAGSTTSGSGLFFVSKQLAPEEQWKGFWRCWQFGTLDQSSHIDLLVVQTFHCDSYFLYSVLPFSGIDVSICSLLSHTITPMHSPVHILDTTSQLK